MNVKDLVESNLTYSNETMLRLVDIRGGRNCISVKIGDMLTTKKEYLKLKVICFYGKEIYVKLKKEKNNGIF